MKALFIIICFVCFFAGIVRYNLSWPIDSIKNVSHYNNKEIEVKAYVYAEPDVRLDGVRYILQTFRLGDHEQISGKVYLKTNLYPRYQYGKVLNLKCKLRKPEPIETDKGTDFRYDMYLARFGVFSICQNSKIIESDELKGNIILKYIFIFKNTVANRINKMWHEPYASFMAGLLYGYRGGLGSLNDLFNRTGVTHIVAISGYNITIIATVFITICLHLCVPRKKAFWLISVGIILFVLFAGASASVVRAGIMGIIVLLAKQAGRMSRVGNVMILTCVVMCLQNPLILIWDAGFQLSFISTLGLVYLSPLIVKYFVKVPEFLSFRESLVSTLSAITATLPLILYQFGRLSIVAPIVNILILWTLPPIMALGFLAVLISFVYYPFAQVIAWFGWLGLSYIIAIVKLFATLPFASVELRVPIWAMVLMYLGLCGWVYEGNKKTRAEIDKHPT